MSIAQNLETIKTEIGEGVRLVVVSKTRPAELIEEAYNTGHRDFGENKAREAEVKAEKLPKDIRWHFIGHLQRNKVKYIAPFVHLIHSVDSLRLLKEINKEAGKNDRVIQCLLQVYIAREEAKFGLSEEETEDIIGRYLNKELPNIRICGLMGMATNTEKSEVVEKEFKGLAAYFYKIKEKHFSGDGNFEILSMGMSQDYKLALKNDTNMLRIGSAVFS